MVIVTKKLVSILLLSLAILVSSVIFPGASAYGHDAINVSSSGHLSFSIVGAEGRYNSTESATLTISAPKEGVRVNFSASPLAYQGSPAEKYDLDVTYVVKGNTQTYRFKPGGYLTIKMLSEGRHQFDVSGFVDIKSVAEQAAGSYRGEIWVTVSALGR